MLSTVPRKLVIMVTEPLPLANTAFGSEIELPLASHTLNLTGTVLPCWKTLVPSALIGGKMTPPGSCPVPVPDVTLKDAVPLLGASELSPAMPAAGRAAERPSWIDGWRAVGVVARALALVLALPPGLS